LKEKISSVVENAAQEAVSFLLKLISFPSLSGNESEALDFAAERFAELGLEVKKVPIPDGIKGDPDYTKGESEFDYEGRFNLLVRRPGTSGEGRSLILQSHVDVVAAEAAWKEAFSPVVRDGFVFGRGACDAKGQVATIYLTMLALQELGVELPGNIDAQVVIEEEVGGNGALAFILGGYRADGVIVLEGTNLQIHPANRGAVWFQLYLEGKSVHMGRKHEGVSAIEKAMKVIQRFGDYERKLVEESRGYPLFERYEYPVQLNVGIIHAGLHPSMVPEEAVVEGGVGFLPNKGMETVKSELREIIESMDDEWIRSHYRLEFEKLHNDAFEIPADHPLVVTLHKAAMESGIASEVYGWNVSCDARLYAKRGGMPTVVFGPGDIADAHSSREKIEIKEITEAAKVLTVFTTEWCSKEGICQ